MTPSWWRTTSWGARSCGTALLDGPGKVGQALGLTVAHSGLPLGHPDAVRVLRRERAVRLATGPRVGIDYAAPADVAAPWRVADADSRWVGRRASLRPHD